MPRPICALVLAIVLIGACGRSAAVSVTTHASTPTSSADGSSGLGALRVDFSAPVGGTTSAELFPQSSLFTAIQSDPTLRSLFARVATSADSILDERAAILQLRPEAAQVDLQAFSAGLRRLPGVEKVTALQDNPCDHGLSCSHSL